MQKIRVILLQQGQQGASDHTSNNGSDSIFSLERFSKCESIRTFDQGDKNSITRTLRVPERLKPQTNSLENSFCSESQQMKIEDSLDDELIFGRKVQKKDIEFKSKHFKQSFMRYFIDVIYGFLKQPTDLTFSIALERLKFYTQQSPFIDRFSKTDSDTTERQNSSFNSVDSQHPKTTFSNSKTTHSLDDSKSQNHDGVTVENLLRSIFYQNQYKFMIYSFDYAFCHLTFLTAMLYFWSKLDNTTSSQHLLFARNFYNGQRKSYLEQIKNQKTTTFRKNIFKTLKLYVEERSQSLNIYHINTLIVYFFLNHLKSQFLFEEMNKEICEIQESLVTRLKMYRRIKRMEKQFNSRQNEVIFEWQLHKYQYENKLIESMEKTFLVFNFLNTHNFVSSPLQKYYELYDYENSKKHYHLKRDYFCIWIMTIILTECQKGTPQSLYKSGYYILTFLAILKKFKERRNFQGISMLVSILYNMKEQLPKVWNHAQSRCKGINQKLKEYSQMQSQKVYKKEEISQESKSIIRQDVIYEMCSKFTKFAHIEKRQFLQSVNLQKHKKFYEQFLCHVIYHRKQMQQEYKEEIEAYKRDKQIGVSFNMFLLDSYVYKSFRGTNSKVLWTKLIEKSRKVNEQISSSYYIDFIDYCFIGSTLKYNQIDF